MSRKHIAVIDYGMGNLHSVASALHKVAPEAEVSVTSDHRIIAEADHVIFPGVGAIRDCMAEIRRLEMDKAVAAAIASGKPVLAVCVGMQALMASSEENAGTKCLGHFEGQVNFFAGNAEFNAASDEGRRSGEKLKVPHMGWNQVEQTLDHPLWRNIENHSRFYFVHSYYVAPARPEIVAGRTHYGLDFSSVLADKNLFAAQFHPEKSHRDGLQLLENFVGWNGRF